MTTPPQEKESRFAELALELLGANTAQDLVKRIWESASPETKQQLADEVLKKAVRDLSDWEAKHIVDAARSILVTDAATRLAKEVEEMTIAGLNRVELEAAIQARVKEIWPELVKRGAEAVVHKLVSSMPTWEGAIPRWIRDVLEGGDGR